MRILLMEDDQKVAGYGMKGLAEAAHVTDHVADGNDGLAAAPASARSTYWRKSCSPCCCGVFS